MKLIIVALALVAIAAAGPVEQEPSKILRAIFDQKPDGGYVYGYEAENGSKRDEDGVIKEVLDEENKPHAVITVRGTFSYFDENKQLHTIEYYADESGFHASGDDVPKNPSRR